MWGMMKRLGTTIATKMSLDKQFDHLMFGVTLQHDENKTI
jgi:hypothetical protein